MLPDASQGLDGSVQVAAGAKGVVELELVSDGATWGRGPKKDIHSSLEAQVDSPSWHLVQALNTLVEKDGHTPAVEGFFEKAKPLSEAQKKMVLAYAKSVPEATIKAEFGVDHWVHDLNWQDSLLRLFSQPTINIEGLVGGYTGPGGKTVLPHRAVAKIDMRLVPDMTAADTLAKVKAHLAKHGFGDIQVNMSGGYDPTQTDPDSRFFKAVVATFGKLGSPPLVVPRNPGSWPGYRFTSPPLSLPAGGFGLGHGTGAHAPDEYYLVDSKNPAIKGLDGATASFVEFLYAIA
jgi:acetylornithine deacetylase/succinyl-diaminopimelate desuccinylase-like protein